MTRSTAPALLLAFGLLAGCGSDEPTRSEDRGPSTDAEFCALYVDQIRDQMRLEAEDVETRVEAAHAWAAEMRDATLPEDLSEEAERGLDRMIETFAGLDVEMSAEELDTLGDDFGREAMREVKAMGEYVKDSCAAQVDDLMSEELDGLQDALDEATEAP